MTTDDIDVGDVLDINGLGLGVVLSVGEMTCDYPYPIYVLPLSEKRRLHVNITLGRPFEGIQLRAIKRIMFRAKDALG